MTPVYIYIYILVYVYINLFIYLCIYVYIYMYVIVYMLVCVYIYIYIYMNICKYNRLIGLVGRVFANGPVDLGSIPGRVIPKTLKMVLDTSLLNTQQYKVCIKGKVEKSRERSSALPDTSVYSLLKTETSGRPRLRSPTTYM